MQDYAEKAALLTKIKESLDELETADRDIAERRKVLSNVITLFRLNQRAGITQTQIIAFRQKTIALSNAYLVQDERVYEILCLIDQIQP